MTPTERIEAALGSGFLPAVGPLWVACSGGADSMALAEAVWRVCPERLRVVHVDHGLAAASARWARLVHGWWSGRVPTRVVAVGVSRVGNREAAARAARYVVLEAVARASGGVALTAHTADDQAETVLMRLGEASGLRGLAGIRERRGRIRRPWLQLPRARARELTETAGLPTVEDPSNLDLGLARVRVRALLPALEQALGQGFAQRAAVSAGWLAQVEGLVALEVGREAWRLGQGPSWWSVDLTAWEALSTAVQRALLQEGLRRFGRGRTGRAHVEALAAICAGEVRSGASLPGGFAPRRTGGRLVVARSLPALEPAPVAGGGRFPGPVGLVAIDAAPCGGAVAVEAVEGLVLRGARPGDRFGSGGRRDRSLTRALQALGVPRVCRAAWPVLAGPDGVVWAAGLGASAGGAGPGAGPRWWVRWAAYEREDGESSVRRPAS